MRTAVLALSLCIVLSSLPAATRFPVRAKQAMVVSGEQHASDAGLAVLRDGGNAVDAAVAVGFALAVTLPDAGNLGGGGFMLLRMADGRESFIDFREMAPASATRDMYLDAEGQPTSDSREGYRASGVPGTVRGLALAHERFGTRKWRSLVDPAVRLADKGFELGWVQSTRMKASTRMAKFPESQRVYQRDGRLYRYGELFRQPDLARTLKRIAKKGPNDFYTGETARLIAADMAANDGTITAADLANYKAVEREPLKGTYRGYEVLGAPPPSSGGAGIIQMLQMLEGSNYAETGPGSADTIHYVTEVMRRYFADRAEYFGDMDFAEVPLDELLDPTYAKKRAATIDRTRATPSSEVRPGLGGEAMSGETTHYSVVDAHGNSVAVTYTLNGLYGSGVTAKGTGVLLNNEMDDFAAKPGEPNMFGLLQGERNAIEPGKRPLSAMSPTIVVKDGQPVLVLGARGGPTIITAVLHIILNVIDHGMGIQQAMDAPRFHHQWMPDRLSIETYGTSPDTLRILEERGHELRKLERIAGAHAIHVTEEDGETWLLAAPDSRTEGFASGY